MGPFGSEAPPRPLAPLAPTTAVGPDLTAGDRLGLEVFFRKVFLAVSARLDRLCGGGVVSAAVGAAAVGAAAVAVEASGSGGVLAVPPLLQDAAFYLVLTL